MKERGRHVIAVVDDDTRILESLGDLLESAGYDAQVYTSGSALLASDLSNIDCLVTDIGMAEMDGLELRDRVKRARPELPVFLISGQRDLTKVPGTGSEEEPSFFRKPFDGPALLAAIAKALRRSAR